MMYAPSVLHYLAQLSLVPGDLQRTEAWTVASPLAAPTWAFTPDALSAIPQNILRLHFRSLAMVAEASALRLALQHPALGDTQIILEADAGHDDALLLPRAPQWLRTPLTHLLEACRRSMALPIVIREHPPPPDTDSPAFVVDPGGGPLPDVDSP